MTLLSLASIDCETAVFANPNLSLAPQIGLGNVTAGCVPCRCDREGSTSDTCDQVSGHCPCHLGVAGPFCSDCLPFFYGFSPDGCSSK